MNILITGATGLIGQALVKQLQDQHQITILSRSMSKAQALFPSAVRICNNLADYQHFNQFDAVINLAGEPIFNHYWTVKQKQKLTDSRVKLTQQLADLINGSDNPPHTFISGSAMGYYGDYADQIITENSAPGQHFPAQLCQQWEQAALNANSRVCLLRTGMVLAKQGGVLQASLPLYRCGLGGILGSGQQYWAWIALQDMVNGIIFLLNSPHCTGSFNLVAPNAIKNKEFNRTLAKLLKRPAYMSMPSWLLKLCLGERSQLLLDSQKARPEKLLAQGFTFSQPQLESALQAVLAC